MALTPKNTAYVFNLILLIVISIKNNSNKLSNKISIVFNLKSANPFEKLISICCNLVVNLCNSFRSITSKRELKNVKLQNLYVVMNSSYIFHPFVNKLINIY